MTDMFVVRTCVVVLRDVQVKRMVVGQAGAYRRELLEEFETSGFGAPGPLMPLYRQVLEYQQGRFLENSACQFAGSATCLVLAAAAEKNGSALEDSVAFGVVDLNTSLTIGDPS